MKVKFAFEIRTAHKNSLAFMGHLTPKVVLQKRCSENAKKSMENSYKGVHVLLHLYSMYSQLS